MGQYGSILLIVVMIVAFYFLIMRPQRKRQQQQQQMMSTLEPGTRVVTTTGIYATIVAVGAKQIVLETSPGTRVTMLKQAVGRVVTDDEEDTELAGYRGGAAAATPSVTTDGPESHDLPEYAPDADTAESDEPAADPSASGMAGGSPIQEFSPGSSPDWTDPEHQTSPWPAAAGNEPASSDSADAEGEDDTDSLSPDQDKNSDR